MPPFSIITINELKETLVKQLKNKIEEKSCIIFLKLLQSCPIDLNILTETLVGTVVSRFKRNKSNQISNIARRLVKDWKNLAKQEFTFRKSRISNIAHKTQKMTPDSYCANNRFEIHNIHTSQVELVDNFPVSFSIQEIYLQLNKISPLRKNCLRKLYSTFLLSATPMTKSGIHLNTFMTLCISRSLQVEVVVHILMQHKNTPYTDKIRSLIFNMKKNTVIREKVIIGSITPSKLVIMPRNQLATDKITKERSKLITNLQDSRRLDWEQANESRINEMCGIKGDLLKASLFTCARCKSQKTTCTQKQTRSADEPMTVFVLCLDCNNRWKC